KALQSQYTTPQNISPELLAALSVLRAFAVNKQNRARSISKSPTSTPQHLNTSTLLSQRYSSFPGDKIILVEQVGFCAGGATCDFDDEIQYLFSHFFDGAFTGDHRSGVYINDIGHALGEPGVGGHLDHGGYRIACGGSQTGSEEHQVASRSGQCGCTFHVIAGCTQQIQSGFCNVVAVVDNVANGGGSPFLCSARGFHGIGYEA